jgi:hypothetical protein
VTRAARLSTTGRGVLEGGGLAVSDGRGVSVKVTVGVTEAVCVAVGAADVNVAVIGAKAVFVGGFVGGGEVTGIGVAEEVQANKDSMQSIRKIGAGLIGKIVSPYRILYPINWEVKQK